jgi:glucose/arabinose dehydrogenase
MGRDLLGDELPPDELNIIPTSGEAPGDYGWPNCYGDRQVDPFGGLSISCQTQTRGSFYDYPAHYAPLGLRFIPEGVGWPTDWEGDLLVSWHGSWNKSKKSGYKVVRLELDDQQTVVAAHDFLTGFLQGENQVIGRPVDLLFAPDGSLFISDDGNGRVYVVQPTP